MVCLQLYVVSLLRILLDLKGSVKLGLKPVKGANVSDENIISKLYAKRLREEKVR